MSLFQDLLEDPYRLEAITEQWVQTAEEKFNVKLPESYIQLLKEQNGGYITKNAIYTGIPTSSGDDFAVIEYIWGIGKENSILETYKLVERFDLPDNIVLFSGTGEDWFAFDYRYEKENPPILFLDYEMGLIMEIAPNFQSFLDSLYVEELEIIEE